MNTNQKAPEDIPDWKCPKRMHHENALKL